MEALAVGVAVYVVMRFVVPHSVGGEARSLIGAAVAFVAATIALRFGKTKLR